jgi:hypothetical protein
LTGSNKEYIDRVIPHLSRLLVRSLDDLAGCECVVIGHNYAGVEAFLDRTDAQVIDLTGTQPLLTAKAVALAY